MMNFLKLLRWMLHASMLCLVFAGTAAAATLPAGFSETLIASGLEIPVSMAFAPDGRLFVCEQAGRLRIIKGDSLLPEPFVTLTVDGTGDRGLLGVAFDPAFRTNGYVYVLYTATAPSIHNRVSRFTADGDVAVAGSETILLDLGTLEGLHSGGAIHFGGDGKLYVAVGDGQSAGSAQDLSDRFGKILRINPDGTIPEDNPFYTTATDDNRAIWALGLRNPFTFAVEPVFGKLFINDVGENGWEEINEGVAGANYGWPESEGDTTDPNFRSPLHAYNHDGGCAITGGAFHSLVRAQFPFRYWGAYFFADFCGGWIRARRPDGSVTEFATDITHPVDLKTAADGSLYYLAHGPEDTTGAVYRIGYTPPAPWIELTANGGTGPLFLTSGQSLRLGLTVAGTGSTIDPAEVYVGLLSPVGIFWLDPVTETFVPTVSRLYAGQLPDLGGAVIATIPDAASLPAGASWWFVIVDNDSDGVPDGEISDMVMTIVY